MINKKIVITAKEYQNFKEFINKYKSSKVVERNGKYYLNYKTEYEQEIDIQPLIVNLLNVEDLRAIMQIIDGSLEKTFKLVKDNFVNESSNDYQYVDENDRFNEIIMRVLYYSEINDIFDLFSNIFIQIISSHKLKNGNKRFCFFFLINLLKDFGFYFKWSSNLKEKNSYQQLQEREMFCFVSRLSNREYSDFIEALNDKELELENEKNNIYKWCYNLIQENDKNCTVKERQEKVKKNIKNWIIQNILIDVAKEF
ncbi:type II toxin-antitoxin system death-on-curing family toxin [Mesomycoplasma molare]|uniref:Type II toxin-antitoxin system death-on-curing family toxin n=1 Tax=Mesomycoplasma molare TaxID=171288 RepID=A0ABY5TXH0_9BACT|nr:type II toxin-antitoxin system death-on-curing family toxin [Mesomycoplasma molare]UWD34221.1 type II toxin-antitoxin system death-on-curing family toxin [Mesomycoplasma molare]